MKTQDDELPLHQAVEFGAAPEIINLIVVSNWEAIVACDKMGRTPMDVLVENRTLDKDEYLLIHECLNRCFTSYNNVHALAQAKTEKYQEKQKILANQHQEIEQGIKELESMVNNLREVVHSKDIKIQRLQQEAKERESRIEELSEDLRNIAVVYDRDMRETLEASEQSMRVMVGAQIALKKQISSQAESLKAMVEARDISLPDETQIVSIKHATKPKNGIQNDFGQVARKAKRSIEKRYYRGGGILKNSE